MTQSDIDAADPEAPGLSPPQSLVLLLHTCTEPFARGFNAFLEPVKKPLWTVPLRPLDTAINKYENTDARRSTRVGSPVCMWIHYVQWYSYV